MQVLLGHSMKGGIGSATEKHFFCDQGSNWGFHDLNHQLVCCYLKWLVLFFGGSPPYQKLGWLLCIGGPTRGMEFLPTKSGNFYNFFFTDLLGWFFLR